jgi:hypothetical protein
VGRRPRLDAALTRAATSESPQQKPADFLLFIPYGIMDSYPLKGDHAWQP